MLCLILKGPRDEILTNQDLVEKGRAAKGTSTLERPTRQPAELLDAFWKFGEPRSNKVGASSPAVGQSFTFESWPTDRGTLGERLNEALAHTLRHLAG